MNVTPYFIVAKISIIDNIKLIVNQATLNIKTSKGTWIYYIILLLRKSIRNVSVADILMCDWIICSNYKYNLYSN